MWKLAQLGWRDINANPGMNPWQGIASQLATWISKAVLRGSHFISMGQKYEQAHPMKFDNNV